jgi:hypothetical protein
VNPCTATPSCPTGNLVGAFLDRPEQFNFYAPTPTPAPNSKSSNGAVIGGAIGGGLGAAIIIGLLIFFFCRRRKRNQQSAHPEVGASASTPMMKQGFEDGHSAQYGGQSRRYTLHLSDSIDLTFTQHRQHTLHPIQTCTSPCLPPRNTNIAIRTQITTAELKSPKNYQQKLRRLSSTDTQNSRPNHLLGTLTGCPNCQLTRLKLQQSSNRLSRRPDHCKGSFPMI